MADFYGNDQGTYESQQQAANYGYEYTGFDYNGFLGGVSQVNEGSYFAPDDQMVSVASVAGQPSDNGGISQVLGNAWSWFNDPKNDKKSSTIMALFGGALSGIGKQKTADRASKAAMMNAEASQLNAQTNAAADARKAANANSKVNFGLIDTPKFSDKLAVRRARSGAGLMGGTA